MRFRRREFDELAAIAAEKKRVLMCVHNWKYAPAYATARIAIEAGRLGAIRFMSIDRMRGLSRPVPVAAAASGAASAASGGGILIDHGWHVFYLMQWLMGGETRRCRFRRDSNRQPASTSTTLPTCESGSRAERSPGHIFRGARRCARTSALIYGERASLEIEGERVLLTDRAGKVEDLSVADIPDDSYHAAWFGGVADEFERAVAEGTNSQIAKRNLDEARVALMLIDAARKSSMQQAASR